MAGSSTINGRQVPPPSPCDDFDQPRIHGRDLVGSRGRVAAATKTSISSTASANMHSPRSQSSATSNRSPVIGGPPDRRPSLTYRHIRQTSKAPSLNQNEIFTSSPATSPTSPELKGTLVENTGHVDHNTGVRRNLQRRPTTNLTGIDVGDASWLTTHKRVDRIVNSNHRHEHSHHSSNSKGQQEKTSVGEFSLHHLFNKFIPQADLKMKQCILDQFHRHDASIDRICGSGADPNFDHLIYAMAYITRRNPKPLVDTIMFWRQQRARGSNETNHDLNSPHQHSRGIQEQSPYDHLMQSLNSSKEGSAYEETPYNSEYRLSVAVYLTCRVLIQVFNQAEGSALSISTYKKLESIIFDRLQTLDPNAFPEQPFKRAVWDIYGQLLGVMSSRNLTSVSSQYTNLLSTCQKELFSYGRTAPPRELEYRVDMLIRSMKHIRIRTHPEGAWRESCNFLDALADVFVSSHGGPIKHAYCNLFVELLLPVASQWSPNLNTVKYREIYNTLNLRLTNLVGKPRHWFDGVSSYSVLLCASPEDQFSANWLTTLNGLQARLKDRSTRVIALQAIARIVWTYLERLKEAGLAIRRLEDIMKTVIPTGKKTPSSLDTAACEPLIELIRIIGYHKQEYCFSKIIFPLLGSELFTTGKDIRVDQLDPERMVIGIRAFLMIMTDLEKQEAGKPPFPRFGACSLAFDGNSNPGPQSFTTQGIDARHHANVRPFAVSKFGASARDYYNRFCEILGKITIVCDNAFGGQAVLDEKLGGFTPKTPTTNNFSFGTRTDDHQGLAEQRLGFYELLHVAVQALPRCLSAHVQLKPLINLLCTCTAHVQSNIAASSIQSLKALAGQTFAQPVTIGFARFIFNFDARYSTMSEEGLLGPDHIENTLSLYVELLQIWIEEIKQKTREATISASGDGSSGVRGRQLDLASVTNHVDEVESHGVFFLCSQSRRVRAFAVKVLKIVTEFDTALGSHNPRIIHILEGDSQQVMDMNDDSLTVAERSRLQKGRNKGSSQPTLIELSSSDVSYDTTLWLKVFPNIVRQSFELCPSAVMFGREIVCARLVQMQETINSLDNGLPPIPVESTSAKAPQRLRSTPPQIIFEQWKLYLIMACTTVTSAGAQTQSQLDKSQHSRKISKPAPPGQDKISSARALFAYVIPLLSANSSAIREAIVLALSSINTSLFRVLLESLQYAVTSCKEEAKKRIGFHQRSGSNPRKTAATDRMRTEVTQIYRLSARFLQEQAILQDEWIVTNLSTYARELMVFLGDSEVQSDWDSQKLRRQFCGLIEELANGLNRTVDPSRFMSFEFRKSAFTLMEDWCGYSPNHARISQRETMMRQTMMQRHPDTRDRNHLAASVESEKRDLNTAALGAMATLCAGPIRVLTDRGDALSFDSRRMLSWIDQILSSQQDKLHAIGSRALHNLIVNNKDIPFLLEWTLDRCFTPDRPRALESYFLVIAKVLHEHEDYQTPFWRVLAALLFLLGNEKSEIRVQSVKLLKQLEVRRQQSSGIQDFDINIADRTTAVYKLASYDVSSRLSKTHHDLAFYVFSQFSYHFRNMHADHQRQMVSSILPWIQMVELQVDPKGKPTAQSYMVLVNLLEITFKTSTILHNEVQALWQALATGHPGNVQLVLDFVISLCSDRKDQVIVYYAKQIIVYMAHGAAASKVVEFLLMKLNPKNMVHPKDESAPYVPENVGLPYTADLGDVLPNVNKTESFALAHLAIVFLVDLIVKPMTVKADQIPLLLHVILCLWDHQISLVQEQARELLVHLIHELIITKIPPVSHELYTRKRSQVEAFVDAVRHHQPSVIWQYRERVAKYEDWIPDLDAKEDNRVPASMPKVTGQVIDTFSILYPQIQDALARTSLSWGTSCPVRHAACRSLQIFRCVQVPVDRPMLSDVLARLSNTIVHEASDVQAFSMEMLTTLKSIIAALEPVQILQYPHLFWTTCACLDTALENEFVAALGMLEHLTSRLNLDDPAVIRILEKSKPSKWHGLFEGLTPLVYKGLKSESSLRTSLRMLVTLIALPDNDLVGNEPRLLFVILANIPRFMQSFEEDSEVAECVHSGEILSSAARSRGKPQISVILDKFCCQKFTNSEEFLTEVLSSLRKAYFPMWELKIIIFVIGLLTNKLRWYKIQALVVTKALLTDVDTHRSEISDYGPDLISPLLRLLQTEFCPQAIAVLDHISFMSDTPLNKQHMRMSMAGLGSRSLHVRKQYERTQSLYGIPEETGWSVPIPVTHRTTIRSNLQYIYQECANSNIPEAEADPTPEIEFHPEPEHDQSYFALDRCDTFGTQDMVETSAEGGMSDLLTKLNSLDDFFDETIDLDPSASDRYSALNHTAYNTDFDSGAEIYDQETAPILQQTLARTASVSSLHNNIKDRSKISTMNPTAFTPPASGNSNTAARPSLHARSVTSPANNIRRLNQTVVETLSDDNQEDGIFSEDERSTGQIAANDSRLLGSTSLRRGNSTFRKAPPGSEAKDYKLKGLLRAQSRSQGPTPGSPSVPKVPEAYRK